MDEIGSNPLDIVPGAEGLRGASCCIGDMPPGPGGPGNRPPGGPEPICPGLGTGKRLLDADGSIGVLGPPLCPGLGAGNLAGSALDDGGGATEPPGVIRCLSMFCEGLGTGKFMSLTLVGVLGVLGPVYLGGISCPDEDGVSGPPPCEADGVLGPLDISGCGVVEPGIL